MNIKVRKDRNFLVKNPVLKKKYADIVMERKKNEAGIDGKLEYRPFEADAHNMFSDDLNSSAIDRYTWKDRNSLSHGSRNQTHSI